MNLRDGKSSFNDAMMKELETLHNAVIESCKKLHAARPRKNDIIPGRALQPDDSKDKTEGEWNLSRSAPHNYLPDNPYYTTLDFIDSKNLDYTMKLGEWRSRVKESGLLNLNNVQGSRYSEPARIHNDCVLTKDVDFFIEFVQMTSAGQYYIRNSLVPFEEDEYHEFKGHRSISIEDIPPWCFQPNSSRRTRKAASRALVSFLNSGRGGTLYLGIIDEGVVKGFYLTEFQKDHVIVSIKDLFERYKPPVLDDKYEVVFVPVFNTVEDKKIILNHKLDRSTAEKHLKPHLLRTYDFCWCDKDLAAAIDTDEKLQDYVIEIRIFPQKGSFRYIDDENFEAVLPIVYQNEEGKCFFRKSASCVEYSETAIIELAQQQLRDLYEPVITSLRDELSQIQQQLGK